MAREVLDALVSPIPVMAHKSGPLVPRMYGVGDPRIFSVGFSLVELGL